jgi:protoporphyrinogen oxidase
MSERVKTLIVGGGPSGLALAYGLQGDTLVLEKEERVGGLCRSIHHGGGVFDIGGHSFHTPHSEVNDLVLELLNGRLYTQRRDARVYTHGVLIPYPFQKFFDQIPNPEVVEACERGLREASGDLAEAQNFEEYIIGKFGKGIAESFMLPYNRKLWARDIKDMSCEWTSERVAAPKGVDERFSTTDGSRKPLQHTTQVGYPDVGGYEEIFKSFASHMPGLSLQSCVVHIDPQGHVATTADGRQYHWEYLVSTIPLPSLVQIFDAVPDALEMAVDDLDYMSLRVELLLVGRRLDTAIQRIYIADTDIPPHKIALNHNSSDHLRKQPGHAITAEVSLSPAKPVDVDTIASRTISFLCRVGILRAPEDVIWRGHIDVEFAYPVYTHRRSAAVCRIKDWMRQHQILTLGRFGDWEYVNSDKCIMKGLSLARELERLYRT